MLTTHSPEQDTAAKPTVLPAQPQQLSAAPRKGLFRSIFETVQRPLLAQVFRQAVHNRDLHIFVLKLYVYADSLASILGKVARLLPDPALTSKIRRHLADEEKHIVLFSRLITEWGGSPTFTAAELELKWIQNYIAQLDLLSTQELGISPERLSSENALDIREVIRFLVFVKGQEEQGATFFRAHFRVVEPGTKIWQVLNEVLEDEQRHVAYLTEELARFGQQGFQAYIDEAAHRCRKVRRSLHPPLRETAQSFLTAMERFHFHPVGRAASIGWFFLRALLKAFSMGPQTSGGAVQS